MSRNHMLKNVTLAALATLVATTAGTASADTIDRSRVVMAAAACQSALPVFDGVVRKRPLAVQNEGDTRTFITCGLEGVGLAAPHFSSLRVTLINNSAVAAPVSCTLVDGDRYLLYPIYLTRSVSMPANIDHATLTWSASERGIDFANPAFSCSLPPGVGIKTVEQDYKEDIGN
ncbi:hypothetical protein WCE34_04030 [Luteimonas sp. MJ204]|uniref:hypothetical protein n=1 Tax=Luteimonas sp. MJ145 TaxID=3129234 RepID=UPI0031BA8138